MKPLILAAFILIGINQAQAMPCDAGLLCTSTSGRYELDIGFCRYQNKVTLGSLKIKGKEVKKAQLANAFDGSFDNQPILIDIKLPLSQIESDAGSERKLTVIIPAGSSRGTIKSKFAESQPGAYKTIREETLECSDN